MKKPNMRIVILFLSIAVLVFLRVQWIRYFDMPLHADSAAPSASCLSVKANLVDAIATGLTLTGGSLDATTARAVKSEDYENVYFIAAAIHGPGVGDNDPAIGVWASNSLTLGQGMMFAVDAFANEFTDWAYGEDTSFQLSINDDGARESKACVAALQH